VASIRVDSPDIMLMGQLLGILNWLQVNSLVHTNWQNLKNYSKQYFIFIQQINYHGATYPVMWAFANFTPLLGIQMGA